MEVRIEATDKELGSVGWVVKSSSSAEEAVRLEREATQLRRAAHPGVVELGPSDGAELRTRYAGRSLRATGPLPAAELCGLGAAVATVLADLHDLGVVHGAVSADHILVGADGRPVLCGFASSTSTDDGDPAHDVGDLVATLADGLGPDAPGRLVKALRPGGSRGAGPAGRGRRSRRPPSSARALAAALGAAMPDRRLPTPPAPGEPGRAQAGAVNPAQAGGPSPAAGVSTPAQADAPGRTEADPADADATTPPDVTRRRPQRTVGPFQPRRRSWTTDPDVAAGAHHRRRRGCVGAVAVVVAIVAGAVALDRHDGSGRDATRSVACPSTDRGCGPIPVHGGAFVTPAGRFTVAIPDAVVVLGRWRCSPSSLPVALDPRTGQVWAWPNWAGPTRPVTATAIRSVPGATTLRVVPEASGCDRLRVMDRTGRSTVLVPGAGRDA